MENWYKISKNIIVEEIENWANPKWEKVESSVINKVAYHPLSRILEVKFKIGRTYVYMGVPPETYENFRNADSKGRFFNENIKRVFRFR